VVFSSSAVVLGRLARPRVPLHPPPTSQFLLPHRCMLRSERAEAAGDAEAGFLALQVRRWLAESVAGDGQESKEWISFPSSKAVISQSLVDRLEI
jgi:hypothetical protein